MLSLLFLAKQQGGKTLSRKRMPMKKLKELFRLKFEHGLSDRQIALSCNTSHSVVGKYLNRFQELGLLWPLPGEVTDETLKEMLFSEKSASGIGSTLKPLPDWKRVHKDLKKNKNLTLQLLWKEYKEENGNGYGYSQYCDYYRKWKNDLDIPFRQNYQGGEKMFVDYAGDTVKIQSKLGGEITEAQIFVSVLGASNYTYAEAQFGQDIKNCINGHVRAFNYYRGVPEIVVPDNLKSGVQSPCFYDPVINPTYHDMSRYYKVAVLPARIRKPKDKAKVETAVKIVGQQILAVLRNQIFFSIAELNRSIKELLENLNNREMKHLKQSRKELYEELDKPLLRPLPEPPYEFAELKKCKVNIDYHIMYDSNFYSVPFGFVRKAVEVRATEKMVEIYHNSERIAVHPICFGKGQFITTKEHMPANHQFMLDWNPDRLIRWSERIGPQTKELIQQMLGNREYPQQAFRKCLGILSLARRYNHQSLEAAAQKALQYKIFSYKKIKNILDKGYEKINREESEKQQIQPSLIHKNIRGNDYFNSKTALKSEETVNDFTRIVQEIKEGQKHETN
jgi:transposase